MKCKNETMSTRDHHDRFSSCMEIEMNFVVQKCVTLLLRWFGRQQSTRDAIGFCDKCSKTQLQTQLGTCDINNSKYRMQPF